MTPLSDPFPLPPDATHRACSPFGSHVVEKLLVRVESQLDGMSSEEYDEFVRVSRTRALPVPCARWRAGLQGCARRQALRATGLLLPAIPIVDLVAHVVVMDGFPCARFLLPRLPRVAVA